MNKIVSWIGSTQNGRKNGKVKQYKRTITPTITTNGRKSSSRPPKDNCEFIYVPFGHNISETDCRYHVTSHVVTEKNLVGPVYPQGAFFGPSAVQSPASGIDVSTFQSVPSPALSPKKKLSKSSTADDRSRIRTNPWITIPVRKPSNNCAQISSSKQTLSSPTSPSCAQHIINNATKRNRSGTSLEDSLCSSGYGSHDSSPNTSVHVPQWTMSASLPYTGRAEPINSSVAPSEVSRRKETGFGQPPYRCCSIEYIDRCQCDRQDDEENGNFIGCYHDLDIKIGMVAPRINLQSDILLELNYKLSSLHEKAHCVKRSVGVARRERTKLGEEKRFYQNQLGAMKELKLVLKKSFNIWL